ncbi:MAG: hypothetical protein NT031_19175, partial [Planctomycetota bacterium]|nr:hypothetical protein [Planctomycetota bacterium]
MPSSPHSDEPTAQPRAGERPVLVVVGHWDDELISAWGAMCRYGPDVLCLTDKPMPGYRQMFEELVTRLGGRPLNWDIPLYRPDGAFADLDAPAHVGRLARLIQDGQYARVYTHHFDGDVGGHRQHVMIARLCYLAIAAEGRKKTTQLMCFRPKR